MSSDYIQRLRGELLRAAAAQEARPRRPWQRDSARTGRRTVRRLRPLAGVAVVALIVAAVIFTVPRDGADETAVPPAATVTLDYSTTPAASDATAVILRARLAAAGIAATVSTGDARVAVIAPQAARDDVNALMEPGRLEMYYWEGSVLGPDGKPAPGDSEVTGGRDAGRAAALTKAEAEARAARHSDGRVVRSETGTGYFAVGGDALVTNAAIADARAADDPTMGDPIVALDFTTQGQRAFQDVTREVGQGGADHALGGDPLETSHHFAIVVDDRIMSMPFVNWQENPDGIDAQGAQIVTTSEKDARRLAAILDSGPLP